MAIDWISLSEAFPEKNKQILATDGERTIVTELDYIDSFGKPSWKYYDEWLFDFKNPIFTHWAEINLPTDAN